VGTAQLRTLGKVYGVRLKIRPEIVCTFDNIIIRVSGVESEGTMAPLKVVICQKSLKIWPKSMNLNLFAKYQKIWAKMAPSVV